MSEPGLSDPLFILLGSCLTMCGGGLVWLCKNRCRNQSVECSSGCCKFHSDSRLRETIRATVIDELRRSQSSDVSGSIDLEKAPEGGQETATD